MVISFLFTNAKSEVQEERIILRALSSVSVVEAGTELIRHHSVQLSEPGEMAATCSASAASFIK